MKVITPGHRYSLGNFENTTPEQELQFIHKEPIDGSGTLVTVSDGTTNEEVIRVLIDRMEFLDEKFPCDENKIAIALLKHSLGWLEKRTADRQKRGVEGKHLK